jgi:8-oxo-dGTP pyrophosphatase MutT (NUDIX family)
MHREPVLALLTRHRSRAADAHELAMVDEILGFVGAHEDCFHRSCLTGHLTGSAWITDAAGARTLLTHHRKLDKWLQLGGHADGQTDVLQVALREAREESGLSGIRVRSEELFDVDRHWIPERKGVPGHWHLDLRFWLEADPSEPLVVSDESHDLSWVAVERVGELNPEESMLRMVRKTSGQSGKV